MFCMKPKDAMKLDIFKLPKLEKYPKKSILPEDGVYRYLYQPHEQQPDLIGPATCFIWTENTYRLDRTVEQPGNCVLHCFKGGPDRAFVHEELTRTY